MKKSLLFLILFQQMVYGQQAWRPVVDHIDDFDRCSLGEAVQAGRNQIIVRNGHVFMFNVERATYPYAASHFAMAKYSDGHWQSIDSPFWYDDNALGSWLDCTVDYNETPYLFFNDVDGVNKAVVKKYDGNNWVDVGGGPVSTTTSTLLNIAVGTDNQPVIMYRESDMIKFKKFDGANWNLLSQTAQFIPYTDISLTLDNNNVPYVVSNYQVGNTYNCFIRKFNGSAWEEVGITGFSDKGKSLVFDNSNIPYMCLDTTIMKFTGSAWEEIPDQDLDPNTSTAWIGQMYFGSSNELYVGYIGSPLFSSLQYFYVRKLVNGTWQPVLTNDLMYDKVYTIEGDTVYRLYYSTSTYPHVTQKIGEQWVELSGFTNFSSSTSLTSPSSPDSEILSHDFSICNGFPMLAYLQGGKVSVRRFIDGEWNYLGPPSFSENSVQEAKISSGTDGKIYVAYNNKLSSTLSDTKMTVRKLTDSGWEAVGPVNFSLSAGEQFDFKLNHANEPYVLYMSGRIQKFDGTNWVYVGDSAYTGDMPARLAFDANDVPYIVFRDPSNTSRIAVKKLNGNVWEYVDQPGLAAYPNAALPRIIFDSANTLYIGFADTPGRLLHVKKFNGTNWESVGPETLTTDKTTQFELAVDHNDVPYIAYNQLDHASRREANVKKFNGTDWEFVGEPNFSPSSVNEIKIDFTTNNTPLVAYRSFAGIIARYFGDENALATEEFPSAVRPKIAIAPNPVTNSFSIVTDETVEDVSVFDMLGKKMSVAYAAPDTIDASSLQTGFYIVKIKTANAVYSQKIVKR